MQSCPSYEVGSTADNRVGQTERPREGRVYLNLDKVAMCNGTVYGWRYCFDPDDDEPPQELVVAMYRPQQNGTYQLVPGSYYELRVEEALDSFTCRNITLQPSEYFTVQQSDVVAFCEKIDTSRVELYFLQSGSAVWRWNSGSCSELRILSTATLSRIKDRVFLLSAFIGEQ